MILGLIKMQLKIMSRELEDLIVGIGIPLLLLFIFVGQAPEEQRHNNAAFMLPAFMLLAMLFVCVYVFGKSHSYARSSKFLRRLGMTPVKNKDYVIASIVSQLIAVVFYMMPPTVAAIAVFNLDVGSVNRFLFIPIWLLCFLMFSNIGMVLANISADAKRSFNVCNIFYFAFAFLGGLFIQIHPEPRLMMISRYTVGGAYPLEIMRYVFADAIVWFTPIDSIVGLYLFVTIAVTVICGIVAVKIFKFE
jgi:ABC-type multidrug transport system permease subunit